MTIWQFSLRRGNLSAGRPWLAADKYDRYSGLCFADVVRHCRYPTLVAQPLEFRFGELEVKEKAMKESLHNHIKQRLKEPTSLSAAVADGAQIIASRSKFLCAA
jgi:hypothetical protein